MTWASITGLPNGIYLDLLLASGCTIAVILATSISLLLVNKTNN